MPNEKHSRLRAQAAGTARREHGDSSGDQYTTEEARPQALSPGGLLTVSAESLLAAFRAVTIEESRPAHVRDGQ